MMSSSSKLLFFTSLLLGIMISISSSSWLMIWIGLEINLLSFIPIISSPTNQYSTEITLKYFLIQALSSSCILLGVLLLCSSYFPSNLVMTAALIMKMGGAPFHFWFIEVMKQLNWLQIIILNTFQKISPMVLTSYTLYNHLSQKMVLTSIILSSLLGGLGGLNQTHLNKVMAYSSLNHMGWLLQGLSMSLYLWFMYFSVYCVLLSSICLMFHFFTIKHIKQLVNKMADDFFVKTTMAFPLMSLAGLPPFSGFMMKMIIILQLMAQSQIFLTLILILSSLFSLFFYFRILLSSVIISSKKSKTFVTQALSKNTNKTGIILFVNFIMMLFISVFLILI
uniref:NADH-ubiquinone oxidoreductase chain 2 n=1 Tax=Belzebub intermedius TaxID=2306298 RepID=A0A346RNI5_9EUCA|nr:NADH dehydrogenase subunit 2 [Belzebub intermedius]AXS67632.1 NADH dehydrogenase subunit 2 [Belzebub intermedius]